MNEKRFYSDYNRENVSMLRARGGRIERWGTEGEKRTNEKEGG